MSMTDNENSKCHKIIHTAAVAAGGVGAGLAQLPGSDAVPITAIQVGMIISLGAVFEIEVTKAAATTILAGAAATIGGRTVSQFLVGWIPGIGNAINAGTAASITEAIGWYVAKNFASEAEEKRAKAREKARKEEEKIRREAEEKARKEAEEKARREAEERARKEAEERARREAEEKARREAEEKARKEAEEKAKKEAVLRIAICLRSVAEEKARREAEENKSIVLPLIINSVIVVCICGFVDSVLAESGFDYKKWGIISGILITVIFNFLINRIYKFRKLESKAVKFISYSNFLTAAFNIALSIIVTMGSNDTLLMIGEKFDELRLSFGAIVTVIKMMYYMPLLNFGLLIMAGYWLIKYDRVLRAIGRFIIGFLQRIERIAMKIFKLDD